MWAKQQCLTHLFCAESICFPLSRIQKPGLCLPKEQGRSSPSPLSNERERHAPSPLWACLPFRRTSQRCAFNRYIGGGRN
ncbi:hypothetical protein T11_5674 [Trichinella zimbabwensis]|uniref:Uncharacterized protein n=1 Tax=Trichinella zimbabwensis TaxID=268475 RepID=A0A0V1HBW4_9BILA|nr:hypothetical protein T11_5674 [Trichinella zimbabwensis]